MAKKGIARTATAASLILQQAATPEPEPVEYTIRRAETPEPEPVEIRLVSTDQGSAEESTATVVTSYGEPAYKPAKRGNNAGLRQGETRITCIFRKDQSQVLHDWAKTTGHTFREVCLSMAERYIDEVIQPAVQGDRKLKRGKVEPPEVYADLYNATPDEWDVIF